MAQIRLYAFGKKQNSTARPDNTVSQSLISGEFNLPVDVQNPSINVEQADSIIQNSYNYAYVPSLGRYYWISGIEMLTDKICTLQLEEDVLASYKNSIGSSSQYVLRSASDRNGDIMDMLYPLLTNPIVYADNITASLPWLQAGSAGNLQNGYYVVGVINQDANAYGSVSYYGFNQAGFDDLKSQMFSSVSWTNMTFSDIEEALYKSLFNPFQYISSCMWFPMQPPLQTASSFTFDLGYFPLGVIAGTARPLSAFNSSGSFTLSTFNHPQIADGAFVNKAPFTKRVVYVQPFGTIELDCDTLTSANHVITCSYYVDYITGKAALRFTDSSGVIIGEASSQLGIPIQMSAAQQDLIGAATSAIRAVGSVASSYVDFGRAISGAADAVSSIGSAVSAMAPTISGMGINGSLLAFTIPAIYQTKCYNTVSRDNADRGSPLCDARTISTLSGYTQCADVHLSIAGALAPEIDQITAYMQQGFFYE